MTSELELIRNTDQNLLLILKVALLKAKVKKKLSREKTLKDTFRCLLKSRILGGFVYYLIMTFLKFCII